jgi:catechol 2,3-dioxygenase-like lactoylglutathione lyase family enzyme
MNRHEALIEYTGIHHSAFITADMDSTIRYWRDLLGFRLSMTMVTPDSSGRQYFFSLNDSTFISFFEWPNAKKVKPRRHGSEGTGQILFDHISIGVKTMEDLYQIQELLINADYAVTDIVDHGFVCSVYSFDPNGVAVEFSFIRIDKSPHQKPVFADPNPGTVAKEGPDPSGFYDRSVPDQTDHEHIIIRKAEESKYFE